MIISIGFILLIIELVTPGFGVTGISGIILLLAGCYRAFVKLNVLWGITATALSVIVIVGFFKIFQKSFMWGKIKLEAREHKSEGFESSGDMTVFLDKKGMTLTILRPSGIAQIDGKRVDVTAETDFIEKEKPVTVVRIEGNKIVVREGDVVS
jgi:membrane-bound serine protease (ClpP class)